MSAKIKNLYAYLIGNKKSSKKGWYDSYVEITDEIKRIKEAEDIEIAVNETYGSYKGLIERLFSNTSNGVASNGQSTAANVDKEKFVNNTEFKDLIFSIIKDPSYDKWKELNVQWKQITGGNRPVQTNRALATCNLDLSTTVDNGKFESAAKWLIKYKYIDEVEGNDWFTRNQSLVKQLRVALEGVEGVDELWVNIFIWAIYENMSNTFDLKKQIVKYGAPGTGKTYLSKQNSRLQFDIWQADYDPKHSIDYNSTIELVQFHSSYSYEDFMEGLRPTIDERGNTQLTLQNGLFKDFCIKAGKWECDVAYRMQGKSWDKLTVGDIIIDRNLFPEDYWAFILDIEDKSTPLSHAVPPHFIIIDEINRAELGRVFGELMYCLEYRGVEGAIKTQYTQLNSSKTGMIELGGAYKFFVPHNVYILATMNTIDRSVESFDFAMRRRFKWQEVKPDINLLRSHLEDNKKEWGDIAESLKKLNERISSEVLLGSDYCIGHAYLWDLPYSRELSKKEVKKLIWNDSIKPLLQEYLRGTGKDEVLKKMADIFL